MQLPRSVWILLIGAVIAIALYIFISSVFPLLLPLVIGILAFIGGVYVGRRSAGMNIGRGRGQSTVEGRATTRRAQSPQADVTAVPAETRTAAKPAKADAAPAAASAPAAAAAPAKKSNEKFEWETWSDADTSADIPNEKEILGRLADKEKEAANPDPAASPTDAAQAALLERKRRLGMLKD